MSNLDVEYKIGDRVRFIDDKQREIVGVVFNRFNRFEDRVELIIQLDAGGFYRGALLRKPLKPCKARQYSDQMQCPCGLAWDVNDPEPPHCPEGARNAD